ncbi:HupE/UreJ family protein [Sulfitobacter delicatus]|uniref:HupE / UreJ protein n=1 Tax=Sulfitobacter delicatus TaxID=218672 RepID=A0A1G7RZZ0_9RHOB|nr:HupE/UreJ family protein [Sulfitobacter delicatus]SDG16328.1 HupE / UreJ protein [Sulfitobacter delicatus]
MRATFLLVSSKLAQLLVLSMALVWLTTSLRAHEVQPTIADMSVSENQLLLDLRVNLEALLAGIDLDEVEDTDNAENAGDYDDLRSLPGDRIADRAPELLATWNALPVLSINGAPVALSSVEVLVPDDVDPELPRASTWRLAADLPDRATQVQVSWPDGAGALVLRQQGVEDPYTGYLAGGGASPEIEISGGDAQSGLQTFASYIPVGFDHILPKGLDHILFVLGLFFLSTHLRPLVWQVSAFTLAHTVTLALGAMGWVNVPGAIVEPLIAASIVYVAVENIFHSGLNRWRPLVIFGFGLLHGLGFASVLGDFGLPAGQFVPALIGFNIGVELGQLTVIAIAFVLVGWAMKRDWYRRAIAVPASCVIAAVGAYWFIERVFL